MTKQISKTPLALAIEAAHNLLPKAHNIEGVDRSGNATSVNVNDPVVWQQWGSDDANRERSSEAQLALVRAVLKDATYPIWVSFSECYKAGAENEGYKDAANLLHRRVYAPLKAEGIEKPQSPTSSNARVVSDKAKAAADAKAATAKALAETSEADITTELQAGKAEPERMAALHGEMARRVIAESKDRAKAAKEARTAARKTLVELVDSLTIPEMKKAHALISGLIAKRK